MKKKIFLVVVIALFIFTLTGCIPGDESYTAENPAGFLSGIWHGWISPFSLVLGFFDDNTRVYEVTNTGWWYDFGFYIAIISGFGSLSLSRKKRSKKDDQ